MFDKFEIEEAIIIGSIMGFVEDTTKEDEVEDEVIEISEEIDKNQIKSQLNNSSDDTLRLLNNENPYLVAHLINRAIQLRNKDKFVPQNEVDEIYKEMDEEIDDLKKEIKDARNSR